METLGKQLRQYRELKKFTLRIVEENTGISNAYLSQLENDKIAHPSANTLYKLANLYGIDLETLLSAGGVIQNSEHGKLNNRILQSVAASAGSALTDEEEEKLLDYLKYLRWKEK